MAVYSVAFLGINRTSSHVCVIWCLPMFLFRDESLAPIDMASLIVLIRFYASSHYGNIVYNSVITCVVIMVINWRRGFEVFRKSLSKCSCRFTNIFLITLYHVTLVHVYQSTFLSNGVLVLGASRRLFTVLLALKYTCIPCSL